MPSPKTDAEPGPAGLPTSVDAVIIGAGFAGLAMGRQLKAAGVENFAILDRAPGVGGVWRANRYPGAACDVPSQLYSFSFFLNPGWSRKYSPQAEILAYLERAADAFGLRPHLYFSQSVTALSYDADTGCWTLNLEDGGTLTARVVVSAVGQLAAPAWPDIKDSALFQGDMVHSAHWDRGVDYRGKRVAVIGNAASAIQLLPELSEQAASLTLFQRTPNWIVEKPDRRFTDLETWLFRKLPVWNRLYRRVSFLIHEARFSAFVKNSIASDFTRWRLKRRLKREVADDALREMLTPDYPPGCKRILLSNDFFDVVQRANVRVVVRRPARLERDAIVTPDGERIAVDAIVCATGFKATDFLAGIEVRGLNARTLKEVWGGGPQAYRGVAVSGFPNLFMLYGPNTNLGHNSIVFMLERQSEYVRLQIERLLGDGLKARDVDPDAQVAFNTKLQTRLGRTVWAADCPSWYKTKDGLITNNWSGYATAFAMTLRQDDADSWITYR